jgi:hypothetical protein
MSTLRELIEELIRVEDCLSDFEHPVVFDVAKRAIVVQVVDDDPIHVRLETTGESKPVLTDAEIEHVIRHVEEFGGIAEDPGGFWAVDDQIKSSRIVAGLYRRLCERTNLVPFERKRK